MKKTYYISLLILACLGASCTDMLMEDNKVKVSTDVVYGSPEGLYLAAAALYDRDRALATSTESSLFAVVMCDGCTDLLIFRAGGAAALNRLVNFNTNNDMVETFWSNRYNVIGKANEIIDAAEKLGLDSDPRVKTAWAEAKLFRARCYFDLYRRFDRLYLNTRATTVGNIDRVYKPAKPESIFTLINTDLDDAMGVLPWTVETGRMSKAVAKHVKAQVALWQKNWGEAIAQCEDIFTDSPYKLTTSAIKCFEGANLVNSQDNMEILYAYQFSANIGGGGSVSDGTLTGHRMSLNTTPYYSKVTGLTRFSSEMGGYGWGRFYPNTYLLSLYKASDKRLDELFRRQYTYIYPDLVPAGKSVGDVVTTTPALYLECLHAMSMKYYDKWTNAAQQDQRSSFKDIVVYRLAETYLIAAEAYMMQNGGSDGKAVEYYNKTWERAGNTYYPGPVTIEDIVDEYARELNFEGTRWPLLKRLGILEARVKQHYGNTTAEDPNLNTNYIEARTNMTDKYTRWPIPQSAIDQMGKENFPQNKGWE